MSLLTIKINNINYELNNYENYTLIQVCELLNIAIPRFCFHEQLSIAGNCRMCLIELSNSIKPIISCAYPLSDKMIINTTSVLVKNAREFVIEFLLINHPLDCPICDQGGECDLQDQTLIYGRDKSRYNEIKRAVFDKYWGPFIKTVMTRCIHCTRCVRYFSEIVGINYVGTIGRGLNTEIETYVDTILDSEIAGNIIDICPVGALTSKPYAYNGRSWELTTIETIDILDSFCSYIRVDFRGINLLRILPTIKKIHNEYWITDKIRFGYDSFKNQRLFMPRVLEFIYDNKIKQYKSIHVTSSWQEAQWSAIKSFLYRVSIYGLHSVYIYNNKFSDVLSLLSIKILVNLIKIPYLNHQFHFEIDFKNQFLVNNKVLKTDFYNVFIIYGFNSKIENAIFNLKIRRLSLVSKTNKFFYIGNHINSNYLLKHIGLTMIELINVYYGKHFSCFTIITSCSTNFLTGKYSFIDDFNSIYIALNLAVKLKKSILYGHNELFTGEISILEYNICSRVDAQLIESQHITPKFIYLMNTDIFNNIRGRYFTINNNILESLYLECYIVMHSTHIPELYKYVSIVLPTGTFLEQNGYYINFEGKLLYTTRTMSLNKESNRFSNDFILFYSFWTLVWKYLDKHTNIDSYNKNFFFDSIENLFFNKSSNLMLLYSIKKNIKYIKIRIIYSDVILSTNIDMFVITIIKKRLFRKLFFDDSFFITENRNFYSMDSYSKNSKNILNYLIYKNSKVKLINFF